MKGSCVLIILRRVMNHGKDSQERNQLPPPVTGTSVGCVCVGGWMGVLCNDLSNDGLFDQW